MSAVKDDSRGMDQLLRDLEFLDENVVDSGILVDPDGRSGAMSADTIMVDDDGQQNADRLTAGNVAGFHEFGFGVPERSFVRATFDNETLVLESEIGDQVGKMFEGDTTGALALSSIGAFAQSEIRTTIETSKGIRPLSRTRLEQKRAIGTPSTPLINWGIMLDSIGYQVHRG